MGKLITIGKCLFSSVPPNNSLQVTIDPQWQSTKFKVRDRNAVMFNNTLLADVWFNVGSEALQAQLQSTAGANESTGHPPQFSFFPSNMSNGSKNNALLISNLKGILCMRNMNKIG